MDDFWDNVVGIYRQLQRHVHTDNQALAEQLIVRAEECTCVLRAMYGRLSEAIRIPPSVGVSVELQVVDDILFLIGQLQRYSHEYTNLASQLYT